MSETKVCIKCGIEFELNEQNFHRRNIKNSKDGFKNTCKKCANEENRLYLQSNKEKTTERKRRYRKENEEILKEKRKIYIENNIDKVSSTAKKYREANKERVAIYRKQHDKENREFCNLIEQRRRAKKKQLPSTLTIEQWDYIKLYFNNKCAYCGKEKPLAQEHVVPVIKGGEHTINNIVCACKSCNSSKRDSDFITWYKKQPFYDKQREEKILKFLGYKNNMQQLTLIAL